MKAVKLVKRNEQGSLLLIGMGFIQLLILHLHLFITQSYSTLSFVLMMIALVGLVIPLVVPFGIVVVSLFVFAVSYFVWIATIAPLNVITITSFFVIPANMLIAAYVKHRLVQTKQLIYRLEQLEQSKPEVDLETTLGNTQSFQFTLEKQANLARRYPSQYSFSLAIFKLEFFAQVQEQLGEDGYRIFVLEIAQTIQNQMRYEDFKFSLGEGRFIVIYPLANPHYLEEMTERIKEAIMSLVVIDKHDQPFKYIVRTGFITFKPEDFSDNSNLMKLVAWLERLTETDVIAEYV